MIPGSFNVVKTRSELTEFREDENSRPDGFVKGFRLQTISKVIIDIQAALRIVKHARDAGTRTVGGTLHGIQVDSVTEVSAAVPIMPPQIDRNDEDADPRKIEAEAHSKTLKVLTERCRMDPTTLGRYVCCSHSQHINQRQLFPIEEAIRAGEPALLMVFDPLRTNMGKLHLKAFVPSEQFTKMVRDNLSAEESKSQLLQQSILIEVPVELHANPLQQLLLFELAKKPRGVKNLIVTEHELGRFTERGLFHVTEGIQSLKDGLAYIKKRNPQDADASAQHPALRAEMHLTAQRLRDQATHVNALAAGSAQALDFARRMEKSAQALGSDAMEGWRLVPKVESPALDETGGRGVKEAALNSRLPPNL